MLVVATRKGFYGGSLRDVGDRFDVPDEAAYSDVWMAQIGSAEANRVLRETRKGGVTDEQVAQELAAATGKAVAGAGDKALKAKIAELEKALADARAKATEGAGDAALRAELEAANARIVELQGYIDLYESEQAGAVDEGTTDDAPEEKEAGEADDAPAPVRISRRSR